MHKLIRILHPWSKSPVSHARENHSSWVEKLSSPQLNCKLTQLRQIYWGRFYDSTFSPLAASSQEAQQIAQGCTPARSVAMKSGGYSWSSSDVCQQLPLLARNGQWSWATLIASAIYFYSSCFLIAIFFICNLIQFFPFYAVFLYIFAPKLCLFGGPLDFPLPFCCPLTAQLHFFAFPFSPPRWRRVDTQDFCTS